MLDMECRPFAEKAFIEALGRDTILRKQPKGTGYRGREEVVSATG